MMTRRCTGMGESLVGTVRALVLVALICLSGVSSNLFPEIPPLKSKYLTAIIIYGQLRTFEETCPSIVENVVKPNSPARIIFSLDTDDPIRFSPDTIACLQPYAEHIDGLVGKLAPLNRKMPHGIEFQVVERAINFLETHQISAPYLIKLRTDNAILDRIQIAPLFGGVGVGKAAMAYHFLRFQQQYDQQRQLHHLPALSANLHESWKERLWAYIFTAGMPRMIAPMLVHPSPSKWSFINATTWNQNLYETIQSFPTPVAADSSTSDSSAPFTPGAPFKHAFSASSVHSIGAYLLHCLDEIHSKHRIVYLIGRTWIHFGRMADIVQLSKTIVKQYGTLGDGSGGWNVSDANSASLPNHYAWPFSGAKLQEEKQRYNTFEWREVTESQFRLVHWNAGFNLIDMVNNADERRSFGDSSVEFATSATTNYVEDLSKSSELVGYLLRGRPST